MSNYKEIVTKAVVGKGKSTTSVNYVIKPEITPSSILGCWIINHKFKGVKEGDKVVINGSFDVNIWYSTNNNTKTDVIKQSIDYSDSIDITLNDDYDGQDEIIVRSIKQPTCINADIVDNEIKYTVEKELAAEVVGDTKIRIGIEKEEDYQDEIDDEIKEDFLN